MNEAAGSQQVNLTRVDQFQLLLSSWTSSMWIGIWVPVPEVLQAAALWLWWRFVPAFVRRELPRFAFDPPLPRGLFNKKRGGEMKRVIS